MKTMDQAATVHLQPEWLPWLSCGELLPRCRRRHLILMQTADRHLAAAVGPLSPAVWDLPLHKASSNRCVLPDGSLTA